MPLVGGGEFVKEAGEADCWRKDDPVATRPDVRDFRRPCADEGRESVPDRRETQPGGGADGDQGLP